MNYSDVISVGAIFMFYRAENFSSINVMPCMKVQFFAPKSERQLGLLSCKISSEGCSRSMDIII